MFVWNMKYDEAKKFDDMILWWGSLVGPTAIPGEYMVEMSHNGKQLSTPFTIKANPISGIGQSDLKSQFDFIQSVNNKVTESHEAIIEMREIRPQLKKYKGLLEEHEDVVANIEMIDSVMTEIENELYQTKNQSNQDPLNFPIKLTNKLAHLNSLTQIGDYPPTDGAIEVRDILVKEIDEQLSRYYNLRDMELPKLNTLIKSKDTDYILLKKE